VPNNRPALEGVFDAFKQERHLRGLPLSEEIVVRLIAVMLRLRKGLGHIVEMVFDGPVRSAPSGGRWSKKSFNSASFLSHACFIGPWSKTRARVARKWGSLQLATASEMSR
jgi:hypothetical protein